MWDRIGIEWDEDNRQDALKRHGVDFADVGAIDFASSRTIVDNRRDYGEPRWVTFGLLDGRLHVVCWTLRENHVRVISFRKANDREQKLFASPA